LFLQVASKRLAAQEPYQVTEAVDLVVALPFIIKATTATCPTSVASSLSVELSGSTQRLGLLALLM